MSDTPLQHHFRMLRACPQAIVSGGTRKNAAESWTVATRPDWLVWWASKTNKNSPAQIFKCVLNIAKSVVSKSPDPRSLQAVAALEAWMTNPTPATLQMVRNKAMTARAAWSALEKAGGNTSETMAARCAAWAAWSACCPRLWSAAQASVWSAMKAAPEIDHCAVVRSHLAQPWSEGEPNG